VIVPVLLRPNFGRTSGWDLEEIEDDDCDDDCDDDDDDDDDAGIER
jgi:hypothetical protein